MRITRRTRNAILAVCAVTAMTAVGVGVAHTVKKKEVCEHNYGSAAVSIVQEATCKEKGEELWTCKDCGDEVKKEIVAKGHSFDEGIVTVAETCTTGGVQVYTCVYGYPWRWSYRIIEFLRCRVNDFTKDEFFK